VLGVHLQIFPVNYADFFRPGGAGCRCTPWLRLCIVVLKILEYYPKILEYYPFTSMESVIGLYTDCYSVLFTADFISF